MDVLRRIYVRIYIASPTFGTNGHVGSLPKYQTHFWVLREFAYYWRLEDSAGMFILCSENWRIYEDML